MERLCAIQMDATAMAQIDQSKLCPFSAERDSFFGQIESAAGS